MKKNINILYIYSYIYIYIYIWGEGERERTEHLAVYLKLTQHCKLTILQF